MLTRETSGVKEITSIMECTRHPVHNTGIGRKIKYGCAASVSVYLLIGWQYKQQNDW